jgi:hypothetical protein
MSSLDQGAPFGAAATGGVGAKRGATLALLAFAQLIIALDLNIVFVALPEIGAGLGFSGQTLQWVVSAYTVFTGGFLLFGGRAADLIGQRRIFIFALWLYALSSLVGGLAWSPEIIIAARAVQGIGAAFLFPATLSLINRLFAEGPERNRALAVWGGAGASGLTLGSLTGGLLTSAFGWPSVFYVNVLLAGIAIIAAFAIIPRDRKRHEHRSFDLPGALTVTAGATLLVFTLVQGPEYGWGSAAIVFSAALAAFFLIAFAAIEARSADPADAAAPVPQPQPRRRHDDHLPLHGDFRCPALLPHRAFTERAWLHRLAGRPGVPGAISRHRGRHAGRRTSGNAFFDTRHAGWRHGHRRDRDGLDGIRCKRRQQLSIPRPRPDHLRSRTRHRLDRHVDRRRFGCFP